MSVREYIGARYVPLFMGEWDNSNTYEPLSIVIYEGNSYTSRQSVPAGIAITNDVYWTETGNYNAQVEAYRQEVQEYAEDVQEYAESVDKIFNGLLITHPNRVVRYRDAIYQNYFSDNMPENEFSTLQGMTETENTLIFLQNPASYWGNSKYVSGLSNTVRFVEVPKDSIDTIDPLRSVPVPWNHANSIAYDSNRSVIYAIDMYSINSDSTTNWLNTISVYDYNSLAKLYDFTIPGSSATYYDGVSYDADEDTIAVFTFDKFREIFYCYILDAADRSVKKTVRLTECESIFNYVKEYNSEKLAGDVFQSGFHTDKHLVAVMFHPNALVFMDYDGHIVKVVDMQEYDISTDELEDVTFNKETGRLYAGYHKRYYNRRTSGSGSGEVHMDIEAIYELNLYTDVIPNIDHEVSDGANILYVNPATASKLQVGTKNNPFKYTMEALNSLDRSIYHPRIYYLNTGSGVDEWIRPIYQDMHIEKMSGSTVKNACIYARRCDMFIKNLDFIEPTAFLRYRYYRNSSNEVTVTTDIAFDLGSHVTIEKGSLPSSSEDTNYVYINESVCSCAWEIGANAIAAFKFNNASIGAIGSNDAAKSIRSASCLVNPELPTG